jgi:hypothetical protein
MSGVQSRAQAYYSEVLRVCDTVHDRCNNGHCSKSTSVGKASIVRTWAQDERPVTATWHSQMCQ